MGVDYEIEKNIFREIWENMLEMVFLSLPVKSTEGQERDKNNRAYPDDQNTFVCLSNHIVYLENKRWDRLFCPSSMVS